mmetsp:Transcript_23867/g.77687  ORF Transcript_23867/g.77687 Transcript_23867/m.77687 type:complete len:256 (+) Transcript_23867:671-1438(+)
MEEAADEGDEGCWHGRGGRGGGEAQRKEGPHADAGQLSVRAADRRVIGERQQVLQRHDETEPGGLVLGEGRLLRHEATGSLLPHSPAVGPGEGHCVRGDREAGQPQRLLRAQRVGDALEHPLPERRRPSLAKARPHHDTDVAGRGGDPLRWSRSRLLQRPLPLRLQDGTVVAASSAWRPPGPPRLPLDLRAGPQQPHVHLRRAERLRQLQRHVRFRHGDDDLDFRADDRHPPLPPVGPQRGGAGDGYDDRVRRGR